MNFDNYTLENNPIAYKVIKNAFSSNKVSHSYLFTAPKQYEVENEPMFLIEKLISKDGKRNPLTYPDLTILDGSKGLISKESVTLAIEKLQQTSLDALGIKILYIKNVENGNSSSLNSLLKFIEEPTKNTFIIITTNNLSRVLSTIKSRSQVINLKAPSKEMFISALQINKIPTRRALQIASVVSSIQEAIKLSSSQEFADLSENLINALSKSLVQREKLHSEISPLIKKDNYKTTLGLMSAFFNDIWKISELMQLTFEAETEIINGYANKKFNYEKALLLISDFIVKVSQNVNFDLYKNKLLIEMEACYE